MFNKLGTNGLEIEDKLGGGYQVFPTDIYKAKVEFAYGGQSEKGALFVRFGFKVDGKDFVKSIYVTNRNGENFFTSKQGNKVLLPGFVVVESICQMIAGKSLSDARQVTKVVNDYNPETGKTENFEVTMLVELLNGEILLAIQQLLENKYKGGGTVDTNDINTVFHPETKQTLAEAMADREASFHDKWLTANKDKVRDNTKNGTKGGVSPSTTGTNSAGESRAKSLFAK